MEAAGGSWRGRGGGAGGGGSWRGGGRGGGRGGRGGGSTGGSGGGGGGGGGGWSRSEGRTPSVNEGDPRAAAHVDVALEWAQAAPGGDAQGNNTAGGAGVLGAFEALRQLQAGALPASCAKKASQLIVDGCGKLVGGDGGSGLTVDDDIAEGFLSAANSLLRQEGTCPDHEGCSRAAACLLTISSSSSPPARPQTAAIRTMASLLHASHEAPPPIEATISCILPLALVPTSSSGSLASSPPPHLHHAACALGNACVKAGPQLLAHILPLITCFVANIQACSTPWLLGMNGSATQGHASAADAEGLLASNVRGLDLLLTECATNSAVTSPAAKALSEADQGRLLRRLTELLVLVCCTDHGAARPSSSSGAADDSYMMTSGYSSSETDGAGGRGGAARQTITSGGKLRMHALLAVQAVAKVQPKCLHPHWQTLLPTDQKGLPGHVTLVGVMCMDPSPRVRGAAAAAVQAVLQRSRTYMAAAEDRRASTFTSLSQTLAIVIRATHRALCGACLVETHPATAQQVVKALSVLALNVPYGRLKSGLLAEGIETMAKLLAPGSGGSDGGGGGGGDVPLRTAALSCIGTLLDSPQALEEVEERGRKGQGSVELLCVLLRFAGEGGGPTPVRVEGWRAIGSLARRGPGVVSAKWDEVLCVLLQVLSNAPNAVRVHAAKAVELLVGASDEKEDDGDGEAGVGGGGGGGGGAGGGTPTSSPQRGQRGQRGHSGGSSTGARAAPPTDLESATLAVSGLAMVEGATSGWRLPERVWEGVVSSLLPVMIKDEQPAVRASAVSTIAMIPHAVPGAPACIEHVWAAAKPGEACDMPIRAASLRALGVLSHEEPHKSDVQTLIRVAGALDMCSRDPSLQVRMKAGWALASLCENPTVILEGGKSSEYVRHHAGLTLLRLAELSLRLMADNDKVRVYGARALGNLGHAPEFVRFIAGSTSSEAATQLCSRIEAELCRVISSLTFSVKVRWNACHAAGLLLANPLASSSSPPWGTRLLQALGSASEEADNFKVRTQATRGIRYATERQTHIVTRDGVDDASPLVARWRTAVRCALADISGLDSSQYKYKDSLRLEQSLCVLMLTSLLRPGDIGPGCLSEEEAACVLDCLRSTRGNAQADALSGPCGASLRAIIEGDASSSHIDYLLDELGRFADGSGARGEGVDPFRGGPRLSEG